MQDQLFRKKIGLREMLPAIHPTIVAAPVVTGWTLIGLGSS